MLFSFLTGQTPVNIISIPEEAVVFLNGEELGESPIMEASVDTGFHELSIEKDGFVTVAETIHIASALGLDIELRLIPLIPVMFKTAEEGLVYEWDGKHKWTHQNIRFDMERGRHQLHVYRNKELIDEAVFSIDHAKTIEYVFTPQEEPNEADTGSPSPNISVEE